MQPPSLAYKIIPLVISVVFAALALKTYPPPPLPPPLSPDSVIAGDYMSLDPNHGVTFMQIWYDRRDHIYSAFYNEHYGDGMRSVEMHPVQTSPDDKTCLIDTSNQIAMDNLVRRFEIRLLPNGAIDLSDITHTSPVNKSKPSFKKGDIHVVHYLFRRKGSPL